MLRISKSGNFSLAHLVEEVKTVENWVSQKKFKPNFQSVEFSERAEILLFARENVALKLNG